MASSVPSKMKGSSPVVSTRRKVEVLGVVLMVLALLLSLAFATYQPADDSVAQSAPLFDALLNPGQYRAVGNALGLLGAELARALVPGFLGYSILLYSLTLMVWGYAVFRHWSLRPLLYPTGLVLLSAFVTAVVIGWFARAFDTDLARWAGAVGMGMAAWMQGVFGAPGSLILLLLAVTVMFMLVVDHNIQRSVDRVIEAVEHIDKRIRSEWAAWNERRDGSQKEDIPDQAPAADAAEATNADRTSPENTSSSAAAAPESADSESPTSAPAPSSPTDDGSQDDAEGEKGDEADGDASDDVDAEELEEAFGDASEAPPPPDTSANVRSSDEDDPSPSSHEIESRTSPEAAEAPDESEASPPADETSPSSDAPAERSSTPDDADPDDAEPNDASDEETPPAPPTPEDEDMALTVQERVEEEKADEIERPAEPPEQVEYESPPLDLLVEPSDDDPPVDREELEKNKSILLDKLDTYNVDIEDISAVVGPTVTRYELTPAPGVKVSRIKSLEDDLAMAMAASGVRMLTPIPGKSAIGVEIPNSNRELVRLREVIGTAKFRDTDMTLPLPMGKSIEGEVFLADLTEMPHLLIAGATGSGKSVGLNSLITGLIYASHPMNLRFVVIDPKKIELQQYTALDTQFVAQPPDVDQTVVTDIEEAAGVLKSVEKEMEERYDLLSDANVRGIEGYNRKFKEGELSPADGHRHMPYIVVVVDELADLMMAVGDDIEGPISRLAQMARAVGIHLILATQRPSVDVITGVIKANFPSRIAYEVASMADSRTILDQGGAEDLVGNGDMLFLSGSDMRRLQGPFVSVEEVEEVVDHVSEQPGVTPYELPSLMDAGHGPSGDLGVDDTDEKFEKAARVTVRRQQGSVSLLQRKLAVGYTRAARIVDQLEEAGIVGPHNGTKAREVLVADEQELDRLLKGEEIEDDA